jgi:cellulose synthase operon protein C
MSHFARFAAFGATAASVILNENAGFASVRQQFAPPQAPFSDPISLVRYLRLPHKMMHRRLSGCHALALVTLAICALAAGCDGNQAQTLVESGKSLAANSDHTAAIIQFKSALQRDPSAVEPRFLLGKALLASGDPVGAELEFSRVLASDYEPSKVVPLIARSLVLAGDYKKLIQLHGKANFEDKLAQADFQTEMAAAWAGLGDAAKTEAAIGLALAAMPEHTPANLLRARFLGAQRKWDEAAKQVDAVLARDPGSAEAWVLRGEIHKVQNQRKEAQASLDKALAINKQHMPAIVAVIALALDANDLPKARQGGEQLKAVAPGHPTTAYVEAHLAFLAGEDARARELTQRLVLTIPDHVGILLLAGAVESKFGAVAQSAVHFGKALALNPELDAARESLASAELRLGQTAKAMETLKPLIGANSRNARALALAGDAELRRGAADAADRYLQRAAKLDPVNTQVQTAVLMSRISGGDVLGGVAQLQALAERSKDTVADKALFATRLRLREYDAALAVLDSMEKKSPSSASHAELRARVHLARRDMAAARASLEKARQLDPGLFSALASLVALDLIERKPQAAQDRLQAAIQVNPKDANALVALAELKIRANAPPDDVKQLLAKAIVAVPTMVEPRLLQIQYAVSKRQLKEALAYAQEAEAAIPGDVRLMDLVGRVQLQAGDHEQAATTFRRMASALPNSAQPYLRLADAYTVANKPEQARTAISKALDLEPDDPAAQGSMIELLAASGQRAKATEYIGLLKKTRPGQAYPYALEAAYLIRTRDNDAALAALREGLSKTNHPDLARRQFSLLIQMGKVPEATKFGEGWMKQYPKDAAFDYQMSVLDITRNDLKTAEQRLQRTIAAYPNNTAALNNLAWVMVQNGTKGAVLIAQRGVDLLPQNPAMMDTLALALAAEGQVQQALDVQRSAIDLAPDDNQLRLGLARIALQKGDKSLARDELQRLQKLGTGFAQHEEVAALSKRL